MHFLRVHTEKSGKKLSGISTEAMRCLMNYSWPGNVRELENTIERAVALETSELIRVERLPEAVTLNLVPAPQRDSVPLPEGSFDLAEFLADLERNLICKALRNSDGNQTLAAQHLSLTYPSLRHKIQTLGIDPSKFRRN
jgi:two-component system response regulator PilR (NtrC family)